MSQSNCDGGADPNNVCPTCQTPSHSIPGTTLLHILEPASTRDVSSEKTYRLCQKRTCPVLYFSFDHNQVWKTSDARPSVGFKQPQDQWTQPVCYCFGYTKENIAKEIEKTGESTAVEWISKRVQNDECACEFKNPTGRCCLADVQRAVKKAKTTLKS